MLLSELLKGFFEVSEGECSFSQIVLDSRKVQKNSLFFAIKGREVDGRHYIKDAISKGASAILVESDTPKIEWISKTPLLHIPQLANQMAELAARFYGYPAKKMQMIGVTGTNGKTSCTHFLAQILSSINFSCGIIGTLGNGFYGALSPSLLTTPDALALQSLLHDFANANARCVAMEVSSHSIHQARVNAIDFEVGIFTNLTQDHLDYHGTMENYASVKRRFLEKFPIKHLVLNADDRYGKKWINEFSHPSIIAYSLHSPSVSHTQCVYAHDIELSLAGINANVITPWGEAVITLPLIGEFNLLNVLAVVATFEKLNSPMGGGR